MMSLL
jgi:hypothetical protein